MHVKCLKQYLIHSKELNSPITNIIILTTVYQVQSHLSLTKTLWGVNFSIIYKKYSFLIVIVTLALI